MELWLKMPSKERLEKSSSQACLAEMPVNRVMKGELGRRIMIVSGHRAIEFLVSWVLWAGQ